MSQAPPATRSRARAARSGDSPSAPAAARLADLGLIAGLLALTFLLGVFPHKDTDIWWHLKAGDEIRRTGQVPTVDNFTYGAQGHPWVDLHWGFQVALSWGFARGGVVGLNLAKCALTCLAVLLLIGSRRREWPVWPMVLAWLPALLVLGGRMYIRPETVSLLYLAIVLAVLFRWEKHPLLAFLLPVVQVGWVNTQGLFVLGPILIGFALVDAATRPGALARERRGWWRTVGAATGLTSLACLFNPYGLAGAIYPIQLAATMANPIFKNSIGELKPLLTFIEEVGLDSLPLGLHLATMAVGALSFFLPLLWSGYARLANRRERSGPVEPSQPRRGRKSAGGKKGPAAEDAPAAWRLSPFRLLLFGSFSALSLAATRNSHQFAAVVGTVTAWNFGEWAAAIRARRLRGQPEPPGPRGWPRLATLGAVALVFGAVASGRFYAWAGEGRTVGLGEEPLWFPREAVQFAGGPGMPDRLLGFHNGHPALYEYYWAPRKKVYTDARLEVMGPDLYKAYLDLQGRIGNNTPGWADELDAMGRPAVLIDNVDAVNARLAATLLTARHWRCVWFDPIACVFVHDSLGPIVEARGVDFGARHFGREAATSRDDPATLAATARALRNIATALAGRPGAEPNRRALIWLGLDHARRLRETAPRALDGWKQAGLLEYLREPSPGDLPIPRHRLPFQAVFDLSPVRATYELTRALEIDPDDGICLFSLALLYAMRGMDEAALPLLERFAAQPNKNLTQQGGKAQAAGKAAAIRARLGPSPSTRWANLSELEGVVSALLAEGRASAAAEVIEGAHRTGARPWEWADRLAVLRLHLGQPDQARAAWQAATGAPAATRSARVAVTQLVEGDFEAARKSYREALAAEPALFEAHYGLAVLEQDDGQAAEALAHARLATKAATNDHSRQAARGIVSAVTGYAHPPTDRP
jgi:tetratricopeptide (TPR) repeat protein